MNVSEIGKAIADNIEKRGHYQGGSSPVDDQRCCVLVNPAWPGTDEFISALVAKIGLPPREALVDIFNWNDFTSTPTVLETLRSL